MNKKIRMIATTILLLGMASLIGGCKKGIVDNVSPTTKVVEVGEKTIMTCTFNKGQEVEWSKSNDNISFITTRSSKIDEIDIMGMKEGLCTVTATGRSDSKDSCIVSVKTRIRPGDPIAFYKGDIESIKVQSGYLLKHEIMDPLIVGEDSFLHNYSYSDNDTSFHFYSLNVKAKLAGETWIRFYDEQSNGQVVDTGILVKVLPSNNVGDYFEPVDFNDTQDSVKMKVGANYQEVSPYSELTWCYEHYYDSDFLFVYFDENGSDLVSAFAAVFSEEEAKNNITEGINEEYSYLTTYDTDNGQVEVRISSDLTKVVLLQEIDIDGTDYLMVMYMPFSDFVNSKDVVQQQLNRLFDAFKQ